MWSNGQGGVLILLRCYLYPALLRMEGGSAERARLKRLSQAILESALMSATDEECVCCKHRYSENCAECGKVLEQEKRLTCNGCYCAYYCGRECQLAHWRKEHKLVCREAARLYLHHLGSRDDDGVAQRILEQGVEDDKDAALCRKLISLTWSALHCKPLDGEEVDSAMPAFEDWHLSGLLALSRFEWGKMETGEGSEDEQQARQNALIKLLVRALTELPWPTDRPPHYDAVVHKRSRLCVELAKWTEEDEALSIMRPHMRVMESKARPRHLQCLPLCDYLKVLVKTSKNMKHLASEEAGAGGTSRKDQASFRSCLVEANDLADRLMALIARSPAGAGSSMVWSYLNDVASECREGGMYDLAYRMIQRATQIAPPEAKTRCAFTHLSILLGVRRIKEAKAVAEELLGAEHCWDGEEDDEDRIDVQGTAHLRLGEIAMEEGDFEQAERHALAVQQLVPSFDHFRVKFEGEAIKDAMFVDDHFRLLFQSMMMQADSLERQEGRLQEAVEIDKQLEDAHEELVRGYAERTRTALLLLQQGEKEQAMAMLRRACEAAVEAAGGCQCCMAAGQAIWRLQRPFRLLADLLKQEGRGDEEEAQALAKQLSSLEEKEARLREEVLNDARAIMSARQVVKPPVSIEELIDDNNSTAAGRQAKAAKSNKKKKRKSKQKGGGSNGHPSQSVADEEEDDDDECAICLNPLTVRYVGEDEDGEEGGQMRRGSALACGHRYHPGCMDLWMGRCSAVGIEGTCPSCRAKVVRSS